MYESRQGGRIMHLGYRSTCRVCGSKALTNVISLGEQHLQGSFIKPGKEMPPMRKIALSLVRCDPTKDERACGLLQMEHTVPPEVLYSAYWYRSGTNNTMRTHLRTLAEDAVSLLGRTTGSVLDIGCNDGTLLHGFPAGFEKYGVDPSDVAQEVTGETTIIQDLFPSEELKSSLQERRLDIITSIAMFYDIEDPIAFTREIKSILAPEGMWIIELSYMPSMLEMTSYDTICHEHLEYYSLAVIEYVLKQVGLKVFNATLNDINGGSIRCYATHADNHIWKKSEFVENIKILHQREFDLKLDTDEPYENFQNRVNVHKEQLTALLKELKAEGKKIHIYGASTKGNTILQWCGIDGRIIDVAAERNPDKYGARTLGTDIPIVSEEESRAMQPDYYLVLPWHFKAEFLEREKETIEKGVGFIFPLPSLDIVKLSKLRQSYLAPTARTGSI
jgi:2-polyprenyl-3-methyl-5-hydroxy-6-metoxy-1,4-benzoquinol methylase